MTGDIKRLKILKGGKSEINIEYKLRSYLERLLPTLYIIRHGFNISIDEKIDASKHRLKDQHNHKLKRLLEAKG